MKRCMIVDDSSVIRKVAKRILGGPDMTVVEAANGTQAIEMCTVQMPDLLIVEGAMKDIAAVEFIRHVMSIPSPVRPQIMVCMSHFDIGFIMRAKRAGASGYVLKPFSRAQLLERFRTLQVAA